MRGRRAPCTLVLDQDERPNRDERGEHLDVGVLERDAAPGPVEMPAVEGGLVGAVDADRPARPGVLVAQAGDPARLHGEPVAVDVVEVRIVEEQEVAPTRVGSLVDDHVEADGGPEIALVELASPAVQAEHSGEAPHAGPVAIHVERPARLPNDHSPRLGLGPRQVIVVVERRRRWRDRRRRRAGMRERVGASAHERQDAPRQERSHESSRPHGRLRL